MRDLELAKQILDGRNLALAIVKGGKILFESYSSGISGLLQAVERHKEELYGSSVADRVVGRAAALLLACSQVKEVYAFTLGNEGLKVLKENNIPFEYDGLVPKILDGDRKDICPFERFSSTIRSLDEAYERLKAFAENLQKEK